MKNTELTQGTHTNIRNWEGDGTSSKNLREKRRVSFIYFIVDKIIILLSESFKDGSPYKYNCDRFTSWVKRNLYRISFTTVTRAALWIA